jgi:hypothetical protein
MRTTYFKNIQFSQLVKTDGRLREFNFRRHNDDNGIIIFSVDVCDNRSNRIMFSMRREDNSWKIVPQELPSWIMLYEKNFHELIEGELSKAS